MRAVFTTCDSQDAPPAEFIEHLCAWARAVDAPEIWDVNALPHDVLIRVFPYLGPWDSISPRTFKRHRLAVMCEVLRVLGMMESNCNWNEGRDVTNPREDSSETISAGCWQVSYDSRHLGADLREMCREAGVTNGVEFQRRMKVHRMWATDYTARLIRRTWRHHGPLLRTAAGDSVYRYLLRSAVDEFRARI